MNSGESSYEASVNSAFGLRSCNHRSSCFWVQGVPARQCNESCYKRLNLNLRAIKSYKHPSLGQVFHLAVLGFQAGIEQAVEVGEAQQHALAAFQIVNHDVN